MSIQKKKIFIVCPISKYVDVDEKLDKEYQDFIIAICKTCKKYSSKVFLALEREKFGKEWMSDHVCAPLDFQEMIDTDIVVAIPENSQGAGVELGWASALGKEVFLILDNIHNNSPLITGLHSITKTTHYYIDLRKGYKNIQDVLLSSLGTFLSEKIGDSSFYLQEKITLKSFKLSASKNTKNIGHVI